MSKQVLITVYADIDQDQWDKMIRDGYTPADILREIKSYTRIDTCLVSVIRDAEIVGVQEA